MIKVAIIDDGISKKYLSDTMIQSFEIDEKNNFYKCENEVELNHATQCALIIKKYFSQVSFTSIKIINKSDLGLTCSDKLISGIWFAYNKGIRIIHFSLGSIHFQEKQKLLSCINYLAARGVIFISPNSNTNNITFPAVFSSVISVDSLNSNQKIINTSYYRYNANYNFTNTDFSANSIHNIGDIRNGFIYTKQSNSFAAPVITASICSILTENPNYTFLQIKQALIKNSVNSKDNVQLIQHDRIDWISESIVISKHCRYEKDRRSYFLINDIIETPSITNELIYELKAKKNFYDTIIVETNESDIDTIKLDIKKLILTQKNIIYICKVNNFQIDIDYPFYICFLPSEYNWLKSMPPCYFEIDEPIICINIDEAAMATNFIYLCEQKFHAQGYNSLILSDVLSTLYLQSDYFPPEYYDKYYEQLFYYIGCKNKLGLFDLSLIILHKHHFIFQKKCDIVINLNIEESLCSFSYNDHSYKLSISEFCCFIANFFTGDICYEE